MAPFSMISRICMIALLLLMLSSRTFGSVDPIIYEIQEEEPINYLIGNIITSADLRMRYNNTVINKLQFSFLTQSQHRDLFRLGESNGNLHIEQRLDRDAICPRQEVCEISLDIAVQPVEYFLAIKVIIIITDINDNAPHFPQATLASSITESTMPSVLFPVPAATDPDSPRFSIQKYLFFSDPTHKFELRVRNNSDGTKDLHLALRDLLDRELEDYYEMKVVAYDGGTPERTGSINIQITIVDINDNNPRFLNSSYSVNVPEDTGINRTIIRVTAVDPDAGLNGQVEYGFNDKTIRAYGEKFGINTLSGEVYLKQHLDYEMESMYNLGVTAKDRGQNSLPTPTNVVVHVLDVNDHAPQITVNAFDTEDSAQVPEDAQVPYFVAYISVFDPDQGDNGRFSCHLDDPLFELHELFETEFKIMTVETLDREETPVHYVRLSCTDFGNPPLESIESLKVVVVDRNDNGPAFTQHTYYATIHENEPVGTSLVTVTATDHDEGSNARIKYSLDINAQADFAIDEDTGFITSTTQFDREVNQNFEFKVYASDGGQPPQNDTATILVAILDRDDNAPKFTQSRFIMSVLEGNNADTQVGQVTATDGDLPPNNDFHFTLAEGQSAAQYFKIDPGTGIISTRQELDRESQEAYSLSIIVQSSNLRQPIDTAQAIIYVDDINDNAPIISFPTPTNRTVDISTQVPIGYIVTRVIAHDMDYGKNAMLRYSISEGNEHEAFVLGASTGDLFVNTKFENRGTVTYRLIIMVKDLGSPPQIKIGTLEVQVNESIPYIPPQGQTQQGHGISDVQLIIIICVILGTVVIATLLIVAIVVLKRRDAKNSKPPVMFQRTEMSMTVADHKESKIPASGLVSHSTDNEHLVRNSPDMEHTVLHQNHYIPDPSSTHLDGKPQYSPAGPELHSPSSGGGAGSGEKDSDSGCCADMSHHDCSLGPHEDPEGRNPNNATGPHQGGPGSILKIKCYHPPTHRRIPTRPQSSSSSSSQQPQPSHQPSQQQSSFSDWLLSENQNLKQSGNVYKVSDRSEPKPAAGGSSNSGPKSVRFNDPSNRENASSTDPLSDSSLGGSSKQPRKIQYLPPQNNYRHYSGVSGDTIPEEPEHIQDIMGRNSPNAGKWVNGRWAEDGSLV